MEIRATPTHPPLRTYTNSSLASCILVQLSDLCNLGFAVHVQYGITNTCWRHARYGGGGGGLCRGASHLPNSLIYKRVPQIAVCEQSKSEKLGILCIFGQRNSLKFRKESSFVRFAPSEAKKKKKNNSRILANMPTFRKSGRDPLLKNLHPPLIKILGMGLVEASQMHRLRKQGGLRELSPLNILSGGGLEYPLAPPPKKNLYPYNLD